MSSSTPAVRVSGLGKCYHLYARPRDRVKQLMLPSLQRLAGRDPRRYYREFWALSDVSFEVGRGETVGIIGRNGSGKSTLLQLIAGTLFPTHGSVEVNGRVTALLELGSGFNPEFSGRENVVMSAAIIGLTAEEIAARYDEIIEFSGIGDFIDQPVKTYSSGMLVRLAFAVSVCVDPDILIVDEALAVGDEKFQRKCFARLERLRSRGTAILFVSHSEAHIIELCGRALLLESGRRILYGSPAHVVRSYQRLVYAPAGDVDGILKKLTVEDARGALRETDIDLPGAIEQEGDPPDNSYDPLLVPDTTTVYTARGARIETMEICDSEDRVVNCLRSNGRYQIVMRGRFEAEFDEIWFAVHIRSVSGAVIAGQRFPESGQRIEKPRRGQAFKVCFSFNMALLPDTYFIGGGIWSSAEPTCVHRVLDALMFRVQSDGPLAAFGYCDLVASPAQFQLE